MGNFEALLDKQLTCKITELIDLNSVSRHEINALEPQKYIFTFYKSHKCGRGCSPSLFHEHSWKVSTPSAL